MLFMTDFDAIQVLSLLSHFKTFLSFSIIKIPSCRLSCRFAGPDPEFSACCIFYQNDSITPLKIFFLISEKTQFARFGLYHKKNKKATKSAFRKKISDYVGINFPTPLDRAKTVTLQRFYNPVNFLSITLFIVLQEKNGTANLLVPF